MIEINTIPTAELNVSKVAVSLNSAQEFGMQFSVVGWGKFKNAEGEDVWGTNPLVSTLLNVSGPTWDAWGSEKDDATYIGELALAQLGLQRAPVEEEESDDAEEASDDSEETTEEAAE